VKLRLIGTLVFLLATSFPASAAELAGRWAAEFDSPIGVQKYVYVFKKDGGSLAGEATYEHSMGKGTVALKNVKVDGDKITFEEPLTIDGNTITILYSGTLSDTELKLSRVVGNFGTEQLTAKRADAAPGK
jgi:hypothetical protein